MSLPFLDLPLPLSLPFLDFPLPFHRLVLVLSLPFQVDGFGAPSAAVEGCVTAGVIGAGKRPTSMSPSCCSWLLLIGIGVGVGVFAVVLAILVLGVVLVVVRVVLLVVLLAVPVVVLVVVLVLLLVLHDLYVLHVVRIFYRLPSTYTMVGFFRHLHGDLY